MAGDITSRRPGVYGTKGVPDAANVPSRRQNGMVWTTPEGEPWLFGGDFAVDRNGDSAMAMGDLWRLAAP